MSGGGEPVAAFVPDRFQLDATEAIDDGSHVVVAAPTGSGKTYIAEHAVRRALERHRRVFYTTPIKALSNQKFSDLVAEHGAASVGLLTGDNVIRPDAGVVVMTTEVLRNMLYAGADLSDLTTVVLDEVHYLQDSYRGPVWEEVIIHLPQSVQLVCLSATISNADELAGWIETVRGPTELIVETVRPVKLEHRYYVGSIERDRVIDIPVLNGSRPNPRGFEFDIERSVGRGPQAHGRNGRGGRRPRRKWRSPTRLEVLRELRRTDSLPAIHFIFSRAGCDDAAREVSSAGITLTSVEQRESIRALAADRADLLSDDERLALGWDQLVEQLEAGVATHHAGMVPVCKELVEEAFVRGLVRIVYATETLALGINMPARAVVIEKLSKWTGEQHEVLTPSQYTQLTGRAGRRGIDEAGTAVVLWTPWVGFSKVAELAASKRFDLVSAFRPTYNMTANLVRRHDPERARTLLGLSFAQYRADAGMVRAETALAKVGERRNRLVGQLEREFGPIDELRAVDAELRRRRHDGGSDDVSFALSQLQPGQIVEVDGPGLPPHVAVLSVSFRKGGRVKVVAVDVEADTHELDGSSLDDLPAIVGQVDLPQPYLPNSVTYVWEVAQLLGRARLVGKKRRRRTPQVDSAIAGLRHGNGLPKAATKGLRRLDKLEAEAATLRRAVRSQAESLARQFDAILEVLEERDHLRGWSLTPSGRRLAGLYHEMDLLIVEALDEGLFDGLTPPELAALASSFGYEARGRSDVAGDTPQRRFPTAELRRRFVAVERVLKSLNREERRAELPITSSPDPGFMDAAYQWALGVDLDEVLSEIDVSPGDFVRTMKQVIDLTTQIADIAPLPTTQRVARQAAGALLRDLVTAGRLEWDDEIGTDGPRGSDAA